MEVKRTGIILKPNNTRVVFRPFEPTNEHRILKIIGRIMALPEPEVGQLLEVVMKEFHNRHQKIQKFFLTQFEHVKKHLLTDQKLSEERRLLIGAYFTQEYSLESAALFNPSIVWHPDQTGLPPDSKRFILSLRATGEGHISSITFRSGVINAQNRIKLDEPTRFATAPEALPNSLYDKSLFYRKLFELGLVNSFTEQVIAALEDHFTLEKLQESLGFVQRQQRMQQRENEPAAQGILALAKSNYEIKYTPDQNLSERTVFPMAPTETNGIEDARFVQFQEEDGTSRYYATYTAYDGKVIFPQILETEDFLHFKVSTLNGPEARNKGMALFPRKINGLYTMISRQDNENVYFMYSDMLHFWYTKELLIKPTFPWEFVQLGNCGSPVETEAGWLVLSHGVGPMRKYSIGAFLLDLNNPAKVIGRLSEPLLEPDSNEREGYVPNVVYSCGGLLHNRELILPYAMSDYASTFATVALEEVLNHMVPV
ncbi:MAG TPA: glycoside hydrolase family 130 protein [Gemmataceae bacterium]|nr:glycoside hydrolase family 130 protein [Gemmataceae bacterium]